MHSKMMIAFAAGLIAAVAAATPADAAKRHKKKVWRSASQSIVVHPATRWPQGAGTGAVIRGRLPGPNSAVPFGYGYGRFDADFNAYTGNGYGTYAAGRRRPWQY